MKDDSAIFTVSDSHFVSLDPIHTIPRSLGSAIAANLEEFVSRPSMQLAVFDQAVHSDRPTALALADDGTLISVHIAGLEHDPVALHGRIVATEAWLTPLRLRDLAQLFSDRSVFYEGLLDLSPESTISVSEQRHTVVVTADPSFDRGLIREAVGEGVLEVVELDVFGSDEISAPIVRWRKTVPALEPPTPPAIPVDVALDPGPFIDLRPDPPEVLDLNEYETPPHEPTLDPGRSYRIESLPQLFDPSEELIYSISDELFAVPGHLVLVDEVSDKRRRVSSFNSSHRYRWDATPGQLGLLRQHLTSQGPVTLHLFVESERRPELATYIGSLVDLSDDGGRTRGSLWFHIEPPLAPELLKSLRRGRLPGVVDSEAVSSML